MFVCEIWDLAEKVFCQLLYCVCFWWEINYPTHCEHFPLTFRVVFTSCLDHFPHPIALSEGRESGDLTRRGWICSRLARCHEATIHLPILLSRIFSRFASSSPNPLSANCAVLVRRRHSHSFTSLLSVGNNFSSLSRSQFTFLALALRYMSQMLI